MLLENTRSTRLQQSDEAAVCLASIDIEHTVIRLNNIEIHQVHLSNLIEKCELDDLYQVFDIVQADEVRQCHFSRKLDYFMGRLAARYALKKYNHAGFNVLKGAYGEPIFPEHIQGSISHVNDRQDYIAICAVQNILENQLYMGIDIELYKHQELLIHQAENIDVFLDQEEQLKIAILKLRHQDNIAIELVIFSAKESIIKAVFNKYKIITDFKSIHFQQFSVHELYFKVKKTPCDLHFFIVKVTYFQKHQQIITIACI
ncbi:4'-phosphopantetheinyl transferase family protein [Acinetobacter gerneri]|uniref:4'-phosphopantetheinyl transferase family protein n=1 Tax=Acinetobacter gerneri TaxID=202952 RepID=UPI003A8A2878